MRVEVEYMARKKDYKPSGQVLEELMKEHNETIYDVCSATGLCYSTIHLFRKGERHLRMDGVLLLAEHYKVPVERFFPDFPRHEEKNCQWKGR